MAQQLTMKMLQEQINELSKKISQLENKQCECHRDSSAKIKADVGDSFELNGIKWVVLDTTNEGHICLAESIGDKVFDSDSNDWKSSELREYLNKEYFESLAAVVGSDNIIPFNRDLLSLDGLTEYETCEDKISLLTVDEYRKYRNYIPNGDDYFWLCTPWSTRSNGYKTTMSVVCPSGIVYNYDCSCNCGVRPFCIFSSSIFEPLE